MMARVATVAMVAAEEVRQVAVVVMEAAAQLDLRAADLILNPACELVPTAADEAGADDGADEAEARSPEVESAHNGTSAAKGETGRLGAALGAALHAACVACADASAAEGGGDGEATCAFVEALLLQRLMFFQLGFILRLSIAVLERLHALNRRRSEAAQPRRTGRGR